MSPYQYLNIIYRNRFGFIKLGWINEVLLNYDIINSMILQCTQTVPFSIYWTVILHLQRGKVGRISRNMQVFWLHAFRTRNCCSFTPSNCLVLDNNESLDGTIDSLSSSDELQLAVSGSERWYSTTSSVSDSTPNSSSELISSWSSLSFIHCCI